MIRDLPGYKVTSEELEAYLLTLTPPIHDIVITLNGDLYEVVIDGVYAYGSYPKVTIEEETERLDDLFYLEKAKEHFADRIIHDDEPIQELSQLDRIENEVETLKKEMFELQMNTLDGIATLFEMQIGGDI